MNMPRSTIWKPTKKSYENNEEFEIRAARIAVALWVGTRLLAVAFCCGFLAILFFAVNPVLGLLIYVGAFSLVAGFIVAVAASDL